VLFFNKMIMTLLFSFRWFYVLQCVWAVCLKMSSRHRVAANGEMLGG